MDRKKQPEIDKALMKYFHPYFSIFCCIWWELPAPRQGGVMGGVGGTSMSCVITSLCYRLRLSEESFLSDTLTIHGYILFPNQRGFLPHLATHTVSLPPSRLSCDTPDFIVLPCVYERETKRGASKRLEGRRTIWQWLFLWWQISNVMEILFLACLCGEKNWHFF